MHKTTVNLPNDVYLRIRNLADTTRRPLGELIGELLRGALLEGTAGEAFESVGAAAADVDDLGVNAEKYLAEGLGQDRG